jgi:polyhydroxybutyrate depolymerase
MNLRAFFSGIDIKEAPTAPVTRVDMTTADGPRHYLKAVPTTSTTARRPLVLVLHGGGASAAQVLGMAFPPSPLSVWLEIAERENLVVIAPNGYGQRRKQAWNDGFTDIPSNPTVDDVGFIDNIIDRAIAEDGVDPERIYVIGVSKGGLLTYRLAAELAPRLAAFSALLAGMPERSDYPRPRIPLPALIVGCTSDPFFPYAGGKFRHTLRFLAPIIGIESTADFWRRLAGLPATPATESVGTIVRRTWGDDAGALQVSMLKIEGGHAEPSRKKRYPGLFSLFPGRQNADVEIAEEAWRFFRNKRNSRLDRHASNQDAPSPATGHAVPQP